MEGNTLHLVKRRAKDMEKLNNFLNIIMGSFFGVFVGNTVFNYLDYRKHPEIYEVNSAPWYYHYALTSFVLFVLVVIVCMIIKFVIRHKKRTGQSNDEGVDVG
ncbi:MAG: hypothetical protein J6Y90_05035 [Lachnospiraceae bacterium]|nr:hypothetical protein [Lachnospiraceae bacterium]